MRKKGRHITLEDRILIEKLLLIKKPLSFIAALIRKGTSTISEEVKRNSYKGKYRAIKAQLEYKKRNNLKKSKISKVTSNEATRFWVLSKINEGLSSYKISNLSKENNNVLDLSRKAINKFINKRRKGIIT